VPDLTADELIDLVIRGRRSAVSSVRRKRGFVIDNAGTPLARGFDPELAALMSKLKDQQKRLGELSRVSPAALSPLEIAEEVESLGQGLLWMADYMRLLHQQYLGAPDQVPIPRQGAHDDRARGAFVELMITFLRERTGRKSLGEELLGAITILADIAIPGGEPDPESIARSQRRKRSKAKADTWRR
jgi:hypothetical protein